MFMPKRPSIPDDALDRILAYPEPPFRTNNSSRS